MKSEKTLRFFLGANTPSGFVSYFDELHKPQEGVRQYIIKGGPGSGKSTLMKKIADTFEKDDKMLEIIHCSSDVDSLDGVVIPCKKFNIVDGTAPHIVEPKYPGAIESIIDIAKCWDKNKLYECREEIINLSAKCKSAHEICCKYLNCAQSMAYDTYKIALENVDNDKLNAYCARVCAKEFKNKNKSRGRETTRFLTALTNKGIVKFTQSAKILCERIYLINDDYGAVSRLILNCIRTSALTGGYDCIVCYCPMRPYDKIEQIFIPQLKLGFMTSNKYHDFTQEIDAYRIINMQRFLYNDNIKKYKRRIAFNKKMCTFMINKAQKMLEDAKKTHDELENYYISGMDFAKVNAMTKNIIADIKAMQ